MTSAPAHRKKAPEKPCRFCAIVKGTEPALAVFEDDVAFGFLDWRPLALGHVLVVPKAHYATLAEIPEDAFGALSVRARRVSAAVIAALAAEGSFIGLNNIVSQSVPHLHFHVVPRKWKDGVFAGGMIWKRVSYADDAQREEIAGLIRAAMA
jgi:histidine triad (HIT) family protein